MEKRKTGGEPAGRDESGERGIPAISAAAMTASGGLSGEKESLISISFSSVAAASPFRERERETVSVGFEFLILSNYVQFVF